MLLMIDNYDSFTYNLVQYFQELGQEVKVVRNDEAAIEQLLEIRPDYVCISPGPCAPDQAGISKEAIIRFSESVPVLGVCLGHQAIAAAFGEDPAIKLRLEEKESGDSVFSPRMRELKAVFGGSLIRTGKEENKPEEEDAAEHEPVRNAEDNGLYTEPDEDD